ncbi:MAG: DedA family protein, partial [Neisseriaceae bacterium]|nr:DedA family protein [Neisseriaceae bacterium]
FVARFMPGLRSPIFIVAGMSGISYWRFLLADGLAALLSVPIWVYLGYYGASNIDWLMSIVHKGQMGIFIVLVLIAAVLGFVWWRHRRRIAEKLPQMSANLMKSSKYFSRRKM